MKMCRNVSLKFSPSVLFIVTFLFSLCPSISAEANAAAAATAETVAASELESAIAEPNLGALLGIGNPLGTGNPSSFLQGLGGHHGVMGGSLGSLGSGTPNIQALRDSGALNSICNTQSNGGTNGNSDALTNLLVYQYLSGSLPGGGPVGGIGGPNAPTPIAPAVRNPHLQALFEGAMDSRTATSVTTTLTTRTITMEASTKFSTSTTSYVTTITSLASSVLPIIFRGSKIITTITDSKTEILTATEFHTNSMVLTPSIVQTLNVEVTYTQTSTKGLNGHYTLAHVTPGTSKVLEQPISSTSHNFDNIDISKVDLANLGNDNAQVVNALTALLKQYNDENVDERRPSERPRERERERDRNRKRPGNTRFHLGTRTRFEKEKGPKYNVIRGFTLIDRPPQKESGTALENTRYSKFRKKNKLENNSLRASEPDRENERYSASTRRRTVSRAEERRNNRPVSRYEKSVNSRTHRHTERSRRRSGRTLSSIQRPNINAIPINRYKDPANFRTTLLTMHISGIKPGEVFTTVRTVTLRGFGTARLKRQILIEPSKINSIVNTEVPALSPAVQPEDVVSLLRAVDKSVVRRMLHSLHDWVNYYLHQVLDETIEPSFLVSKYVDIAMNEIPELFPSPLEESTDSSSQATLALQDVPHAISGEPTTVTVTEQCLPQLAVITETVYETVYLSQPH